MPEFSNRLRELRSSNGLRQKDLAEALGVAQTTIANYEQGARFPDEKILHRIADYFNVSLDYLLGRSDVNLLASEERYSGSVSREEESLAPMSPMAREYLELLLAGKKNEAGDLVLRAVKDGQGVREVYAAVFERTLKEVGLLWKLGKVDVAMEHYFSASTQLIMSRLYPYVSAAAREKKEYTCLTVAVCGEFHEIGARMVADFLEMDGWESFFLGSNLFDEVIVKAAVERRAAVLALSATMFFNVDAAARAIRAVRAVEDLRGLVILVGGRPFNQDTELWRQVGADGFARNAAEAVELANRLVESKTGPSRLFSL